MGQLFIVDAPWVFSGVYSIVKGFLDEKTRNKITILGGGYQAQILEIVDEENLPTFLGGKCECPGGCLKSNIGPWLEYKAIDPVGIERIDGKPIEAAKAVEEEKAEEKQAPEEETS